MRTGGGGRGKGAPESGVFTMDPESHVYMTCAFRRIIADSIPRAVQMPRVPFLSEMGIPGHQTPSKTVRNWAETRWPGGGVGGVGVGWCSWRSRGGVGEAHAQGSWCQDSLKRPQLRVTNASTLTPTTFTPLSITIHDRGLCLWFSGYSASIPIPLVRTLDSVVGNHEFADNMSWAGSYGRRRPCLHGYGAICTPCGRISAGEKKSQSSV